MTLDDLVKRADQLIALAKGALARVRSGSFGPVVESEAFAELRSASLSFIEGTFGRGHSYYTEFEKAVKDTPDYFIKHGLGILTAIRAELAGGWIRTTRGLVSAEVFADFLEMAEHLLTQGYKDPAAVLIGSALEEHLRQLAGKYAVQTSVVDTKGNTVPKKADVLNADLVKANAYTVLQQKMLTGWLDLRNRAAHGHYGTYTDKDVDLMRQGVAQFMAQFTV